MEKRLSDFSDAGLHKSTAFRLLEALRRHRLVAVDKGTDRYRLMRAGAWIDREALMASGK